jgi:hypothetical protein
VKFILEITEALCGHHHKPHPPAVHHFGYKVGPVQKKLSKPTPPMPLDLTIDNTQQVVVTLAPSDASGAPVVLKTPPSWVITAGISTMTVAADGLSATLISSDTAGDSLFTVTDTTPGVTLSDAVTLHVDLVTPPPPPEASLGLTAGTPTPKNPIIAGGAPVKK